MKSIYLNKFDGGIVNDPRNPSENVCRVVTNFDALSNPYKLTPFRDSESGDSSGTTNQIQNFCIALGASSTYAFYGLGVVSGTAKAQVFKKGLTTGSGTDLGDSAWGTTANNQSGSGTTSFNLFVFYKKTGLIYGAKGGNAIWAYDPTGSAAFSDDSTGSGLTYSKIAQGIVHSKDDILYVPYDNAIASNNNGSWNKTALTLPSHLYVTSISEYGNYLKIDCAPLAGIGKSVSYLWDRDATLSTVSESIDDGEGNVMIGDTLNGVPIIISLSGSNSTRLLDVVTFKYYNGSTMVPFLRLQGTNTTLLPIPKQKVNDRLYFLMSISLNGSFRSGLWSIGRTSPTGPFGLIHERTVYNDVSLGTGTLLGFHIVGDYVFIASVNSSSAYQLSKTNHSASYTATSIYETTINPKMESIDRPAPKQIGAAGLTYDSFPNGGTATLKHRVDGGSWETVFTETGTNVKSNGTEPSAYLSSGTGLATGRDHEFRIETTGGVSISGLAYKYGRLSSNYDP